MVVCRGMRRYAKLVANYCGALSMRETTQVQRKSSKGGKWKFAASANAGANPAKAVINGSMRSVIE